MAPVLEGRNIEKHFRVRRSLRRQIVAPFAHGPRVCALQGVSLAAESGQIVGIVGPNGAGKTTLLRVLADVLEADGGSISLCGEAVAPGDPRLRRYIGYVSSDERSFFWRLTGRQNLTFFAALYGVPAAEGHRRITMLLGRLGLSDRADGPFHSYSSGMRKRLALARALVHRPRIVLLDELTNSLDPPTCLNVKTLVREYVSQERGRAALWSTHRLEEIGEICDETIVIEHGMVQFRGSAREFADHERQAGGTLRSHVAAGACRPTFDNAVNPSTVANPRIGPCCRDAALVRPCLNESAGRHGNPASEGRSMEPPHEC